MSGLPGIADVCKSEITEAQAEAAAIAWFEAKEPSEIVVRRKSDGLLIHFCATVEALRAAQEAGSVAFNLAEMLRLCELARDGSAEARSLADTIVRAKQSIPRIMFGEIKKGVPSESNSTT